MTMPDSVSGRRRQAARRELRSAARGGDVSGHRRPRDQQLHARQDDPRRQRGNGAIRAVRVVHGLQSAVHYGVRPVQPDIRCRPAGEHPLVGQPAGLWL